MELETHEITALIAFHAKRLSDCAEGGKGVSMPWAQKIVDRMKALQAAIKPEPHDDF